MEEASSVYPIGNASRWWLTLGTLFLLLFPQSRAFASENILGRNRERYALTQWQNGTGLPQNSVLAITQTPDGYLWLGTFNGLVRFDGVRFKSFTVANTPELQSDSVLTLITAKDGTLWIGTRGGGVVSMKDGQFTHYDSHESLKNAIVNAIVCDYQDAVFVVATDGLYCIKEVTTAQVAGLAPGVDNYLGVAVDSNERLWVGTRNRTALEFRNGKLETQPEHYFSPFSPVYGNVWGLDKANARIRVFPLAPDRFAIPPLELNATNDEAPRFFPLVEIATEGDRVWYSGASRRLTLVEDDQHIVVHKEFFDEYPDVGAIYPDQEGQVWIGSDGGGLLRLRRKSVQSFSIDDGFPSNNTISIAEGPDGTIWVGHFHTALNTTGIITKDGQMQTIAQSTNPWTTTAFAPASEGGLWFGTAGSGVYRWHGEELFPVPDSHIAPLLFHQFYITALLEAKDGGLWMGSENAGAVFHNNEEKRHYDTDHGLSHNRVSALVEDREGNTWIGTVNGLNQLTPEGNIQIYKKEHGLGVNVIQSLYVANDGTLFVGTAGYGLAVRHQGQFISLRPAMGMVNEVVAQIMEDDFGFVWLGTNQGIVRLARNDIDALLEGDIRFIPSTKFGIDDGMVNEECTGGYQPTCWKDSRGRLWFCTVGGVAMIDPSENQVATKQTRIYIEEVTSNGEELLGFNSPSPSPRQFSFPSSRQNIEIRYTGITADHPEDVVFRYRLDGFDTHWQEVGTRRIAYYNQLPPGRFEFQVSTYDGTAGWSPEPATISLLVTPAWWQTIWFRSLIGLAAIGTLYLVHRQRVRKLEEAEQVKSAFARQLIQSQEDERERISHELHDSLGQSLVVISNRAAIALQDENQGTSEDVLKHLNRIRQTSSEAAQEVRQIAQALRPVQMDRLGLTRGLEHLATQTAEAGDMELKLAIENVDDLFSPDIETGIWRIIQEALNNTLKHARASILEVTAKQTQTAVHLEIRDDGCGYDATELESRTAGIGLAGMSERATMIGAELEITSEKGRGTVLALRVTVPPAQ